MKALVTGGAGFIGSHLTEALLQRGDSVRVVDSFSTYYDPVLKRNNLTASNEHPGFDLVEVDLRTANLGPLVEDVDVIYHQAGQPGVRLSWSEGFHEYDSSNVLATQRLLEAARQHEVGRFVYASSSSIYGNAGRYPTVETDVPSPMSPYGVTKLAGEHLCRLYAANWGTHTVSLRYFTVYGPRQRPDMAMHRLVSSAQSGDPFPLYGDGSHVRDFTYVTDVVRANIAAASADVPPGSVFNIAGGGSIAMRDLIDLVGQLGTQPIKIERHPPQPGDVLRTGGAVHAASAQLGWHPSTDLRVGLQAHLDWARQMSEST